MSMDRYRQNADRVELQDLRVQVRALTRARDDNNQRIIELKAERDALLAELRRMRQIRGWAGSHRDPKSLAYILTREAPQHLVGCEGGDLCKCDDARPIPRYPMPTRYQT